MHSCRHCTERPSHALLRWALVLALGAALEAEAVAGKRHPHTLSHATRYTFRTHTKPGRTCFAVVWAAVTAWYLRHILNGGPK